MGSWKTTSAMLLHFWRLLSWQRQQQPFGHLCQSHLPSSWHRFQFWANWKVLQWANLCWFHGFFSGFIFPFMITYMYLGLIWYIFHVFAAEHLGFNSRIPPFALSNGSDILLGLNYASAAAGIRSETGHHLVIFIQMWH